MNPLILFTLLIVAMIALVAFFASRPRGRNLVALGNAISDGVKWAHLGDHAIVLEAAVASRHLLLKKGAAADGALICTAADRPFGFAEDEGAIGDKISMKRLGIGGRSTLAIASEAIAADDRLVPDAGGKVRKLPVAAGTYWVCGTAVTAAVGDNDPFEVIDCTPFQVVVT